MSDFQKEAKAVIHAAMEHTFPEEKHGHGYGGQEHQSWSEDFKCEGHGFKRGLELHTCYSGLADIIAATLKEAEERGRRNMKVAMLFTLEECAARPDMSHTKFYVLKDGKRYVERPEAVHGYFEEILRRFREDFLEDRGLVDRLEREAYDSGSKNGRRVENEGCAKEAHNSGWCIEHSPEMDSSCLSCAAAAEALAIEALIHARMEKK